MDPLKGRSVCPQCGHTLGAPDLVPVFSWLFLRGRCRRCGAHIPARYLLVELLGGVLALAYAAHRPERVASLVLIGTPHKVPKAAFALQNLVFRFLPAAAFRAMAFDKADTFALGNSMRALDFSARAHEIGCPTLILCGERNSANLASARFSPRIFRRQNLR